MRLRSMSSCIWPHSSAQSATVRAFGRTSRKPPFKNRHGAGMSLMVTMSASRALIHGAGMSLMDTSSA